MNNEGNMRLREVGEKKLISDVIIPLINPLKDKTMAGDDCAVLSCMNSKSFCFSTDRVPSDLISFKIGLIDYFGIGNYLAVLNISDIVASGGEPVGLLLNFAFPDDFLLKDFKQVFLGVKSACDKYGVKIMGGDLSNSAEMNLSATSIGIHTRNEPLYRVGCRNGDLVFCSDYIGLTPTAFNYFLKARSQGMNLTREEENILIQQFSNPRARIEVSKVLSEIGNKHRVTCMDNTDGIYQSLIELSKLNTVSMILEADKIPIHEISYKVADYLNIDVFELVLSAGADFQLVGTVAQDEYKQSEEIFVKNKITRIGRVIEMEDEENIYLDYKDCQKELNIPGWNYYN